MSAAVIAILRRERHVVRAFHEAGATATASAKTLDDLGLLPGLGFHRLRERAVLRVTTPDHYYLDEEVWAAVRRSRRRLSAVLFIVVLLIMAGGLGLLSPSLHGPR
jgi:hypothetical protein